jgi:hypothetical protein
MPEGSANFEMNKAPRIMLIRDHCNKCFRSKDEIQRITLFFRWFALADKDKLNVRSGQ